MIVFRVLTLPVRMAAGSARVGFQAGRAVGVRRSVVFVAGVLTGVLLASPDARKAAARGLLTLQAAIAKARRPTDADLAAAVRAELGRAQRTWHLPQPQVEVHDGRVVLRGAVPHEAGRRDLAATAAAVDGVVEVDNQVGVT